MPEWDRIFPDADHRWTMGLRPAQLADFFRPRDPTGDALRERRHWLTTEPEKYLVLWPEAEPSLMGTLALARLLGAKLELPEHASPHEQLLALGCAWESDLVWLHPDETGIYRVVGGIVCFPSSWALTDKLGLPIDEVHGPVPDLAAQLGRQIDTFLTKLEPGTAWTRENWSLSPSAERNQHTSRPRATFDDAMSADEVWVRLEHQLLMRLPSSGGVLFGIRIELVPLVELKRNASAANRLARLIATMSPAAAGYKNFAHARQRLVELLQT